MLEVDNDYTKRPSKENYYLNMAKATSMRGTCLRRNYGAVIVKDDRIISTGYTGAPVGIENCCDKGSCLRQQLNIPSGHNYELCHSVHAEMNAILKANPIDLKDSILYLYGYEVETNHPVQLATPCLLCTKMILNANIKCVIRHKYNPDHSVFDVDYMSKDDLINLYNSNIRSI